MPEHAPNVADQVPWSDHITEYDREHFTIYMRLLDADADGANWREVALIVLGRDPVSDPKRSRHCWEDHLRRAVWMTEVGYKKLFDESRESMN